MLLREGRKLTAPWDELQANEILGVAQARSSDLVRGKVNLFSRGTLIGMATTAGMALIVKVTKQKVPASKRRLHRRGLTPKPRPVRCG